jgi:hypothetical protein
MKVLKDSVDSQNQPLTEKSISDRMIDPQLHANVVPCGGSDRR